MANARRYNMTHTFAQNFNHEKMPAAITASRVVLRPAAEGVALKIFVYVLEGFGAAWL